MSDTRGLAVLVGILAVIMIVIYSAGDTNTQTYLKQSMFVGNSVFVEDSNTATVNGENVLVAHQGFSNMAQFRVSELAHIQTGTGNNTTTKTYLVLSHEIGGVFGKATPLLITDNATDIVAESNGVAYGSTITYVGNYVSQDGVTKRIYNVNNTTVVVSPDSYAFVQTNSDGAGLVLKQDVSSGNVSVGKMAKPFNLQNKDFGKLIGLIAMASIVAYWLLVYKKPKYREE